MFDVPNLATRLRKVRHFRDLPISAIHEIVTSDKVKTYPAGSNIYNEGWDCAGLFVLLKGCVHLCKTCYQGQESIISVISPIIMFNEISVLDGESNPLTAIAFRNCITWNLTRESFMLLMESNPILGISLLNVLARTNRRLIEKYEDLIARPVIARTAKLLLDLSSFGSQPIDRLSHSNQYLASRVSTVPEATSRSIKVLQESGIIDCTRTQITVTQPDKLAELAQIEFELFKL
jgi:CRP-like cAMP-binding protein